jgi:hypothetical protein
MSEVVFVFVSVKIMRCGKARLNCCRKEKKLPIVFLNCNCSGNRIMSSRCCPVFKGSLG